MHPRKDRQPARLSRTPSSPARIIWTGSTNRAGAFSAALEELLLLRLELGLGQHALLLQVGELPQLVERGRRHGRICGWSLWCRGLGRFSGLLVATALDVFADRVPRARDRCAAEERPSATEHLGLPTPE